LLYRGSRDGFNKSACHDRIDDQGPTISIVKSEHDLMFGGFTTVPWALDGE
jgi:hypothetical protein